MKYLKAFWNATIYIYISNIILIRYFPLSLFYYCSQFEDLLINYNLQDFQCTPSRVPFCTAKNYIKNDPRFNTKGRS